MNLSLPPHFLPVRGYVLYLAAMEWAARGPAGTYDAVAAPLTWVQTAALLEVGGGRWNPPSPSPPAQISASPPAPVEVFPRMQLFPFCRLSS